MHKIPLDSCIQNIILLKLSFLIYNYCKILYQMGQENAQILSQQHELQKQYIIESRQKESNLIFLSHRQTHKSFVLRELIYTEQRQYNHYLKRIPFFKSYNTPLLTRFIREEHFKNQCLCSKYFNIYLLWEYPKNTLAAQINSRALQKRPFTQAQIRKILSDACEAMTILKNNYVSYDCLTTKNIFLDVQSNLKILDPNAIPSVSNLQTIYKQRNVKNLYLSPQQCLQISNQSLSTSTFDEQKSNIFIMGIIMIEICLLERQQQCYSDEYSRINAKVINEQLQEIQLVYSPELRRLISYMLEVSVQKRATWNSLSIYLKNDRQSVPKYQVRNERPLLPSFKPSNNNIEFHPVPANHVTIAAKPLMNLNNQYKINWVSNTPKSYVLNHQISRPQIQHIPPPQSNPHNTATNYLQSKYKPSTINNNITFNYQPNYYNTAHMPFSTISQRKHQTSESWNSSKNTSPKETFQLQLREPIFVMDEISQTQRYEGYKLNRKKEGEGKFYLNNRICYDGLWREDLMDGQGKLYYQSGNLAYHGNFSNDKFHGKGVLYNEHPIQLSTGFNYKSFDEIQQFWIRYEGDFECDEKQGYGKLWLTNGQTFEGMFHNDLIDGYGYFKDINGSAIHGQWHQNIFSRFSQ